MAEKSDWITLIITNSQGTSLEVVTLDLPNGLQPYQFAEKVKEHLKDEYRIDFKI